MSQPATNPDEEKASSSPAPGLLDTAESPRSTDPELNFSETDNWGAGIDDDDDEEGDGDQAEAETETKEPEAKPEAVPVVPTSSSSSGTKEVATAPAAAAVAESPEPSRERSVSLRTEETDSSIKATESTEDPELKPQKHADSPSHKTTPREPPVIDPVLHVSETQTQREFKLQLAMKDAMEGIQRQYQAEQAKNQTLEVARNSLMSKISALEQSLSKALPFKDKVHELESTRETLLHKISTLQAKLDAPPDTREIDSLREQLSAEREKVAAQTKRCELMQNEIVELKAKVAEYEEKEANRAQAEAAEKAESEASLKGGITAVEFVPLLPPIVLYLWVRLCEISPCISSPVQTACSVIFRVVLGPLIHQCLSRRVRTAFVVLLMWLAFFSSYSPSARRGVGYGVLGLCFSLAAMNILKKRMDDCVSSLVDPLLPLTHAPTGATLTPSPSLSTSPSLATLVLRSTPTLLPVFCLTFLAPQHLRFSEGANLALAHVVGCVTYLLLWAVPTTLLSGNKENSDIDVGCNWTWGSSQCYLSVTFFILTVMFWNGYLSVFESFLLVLLGFGLMALTVYSTAVKNWVSTVHVAARTPDGRVDWPTLAHHSRLAALNVFTAAVFGFRRRWAQGGMMGFVPLPTSASVSSSTTSLPSAGNTGSGARSGGAAGGAGGLGRSPQASGGTASAMTQGITSRTGSSSDASSGSKRGVRHPVTGWPRAGATVETSPADLKRTGSARETREDVDADVEAGGSAGVSRWNSWDFQRADWGASENEEEMNSSGEAGSHDADGKDRLRNSFIGLCLSPFQIALFYTVPSPEGRHHSWSLAVLALWVLGVALLMSYTASMLAFGLGLPVGILGLAVTAVYLCGPEAIHAERNAHHLASAEYPVSVLHTTTMLALTFALPFAIIWRALLTRRYGLTTRPFFPILTFCLSLYCAGLMGFSYTRNWRFHKIVPTSLRRAYPVVLMVGCLWCYLQYVPATPFLSDP